MKIVHGDCIEGMRQLDAGSVDAIVTDPPYGLAFMGKAWDSHPDPRAFQTWCEQWAAEALRVLKPGGHLLAFGGTRTYHRLAAGIEDAGFEIRDTLAWLYGTGFPKSLDVSKAIDKAAGVEGERGPMKRGGERLARLVDGKRDGDGRWGDEVGRDPYTYVPTSDDALRWKGWGTALKPAFEPVVVARKPLTGTVAANVLAHGTGALNIDGCRIEGAPRPTGTVNEHAISGESGIFGIDARTTRQQEYDARLPSGRWPANVLLDPVAADMLDKQSGEVGGGMGGRGSAENIGAQQSPGWRYRATGEAVGFGDSGGASRFFYVAKASTAERNAGLDGFDNVDRAGDSAWAARCEECGRTMISGERDITPCCGVGVVWETAKARANPHPTVKPVDLMRWLVRLVTPPGGLVVDPFAGSGTTGIAAVLEGFDFVGFEQDADYARIAEARIAFWREHGDEALQVVAAAERAERERERVVGSGQLDIFGDAVGE